VSALLELPPELLVAVARETDEFTRFVLGFVCRSLLALAPLLCALDPPSTSYRFAGLALAAVRARSPGLLEWATRGRWSAPVTTAVLDEALALGQFTLVERLLELGAAIGEYTIVAAARGSDAALVARIDAFSVAAGLMPSATVLRSLGEAVMRRRSQALLEWLLTSRYFKASATVLDLCAHLSTSDAVSSEELYGVFLSSSVPSCIRWRLQDIHRECCRAVSVFAMESRGRCCGGLRPRAL